MAAKKRKPKVKQDLLGDYISLTHKVCKTYLDKVPSCSIFHLQRRLRFHEGSRTFDGDLIVDITEPWGGTLIKGDLIVEGNLVLEDRELPALFFVFGNVRAKNILNLGARFIVKGNVETSALFSAPRSHNFDRHANTYITGSLKAQAIAGWCRSAQRRQRADLSVWASGEGSRQDGRVLRRQAGVFVLRRFAV